MIDTIQEKKIEKRVEQIVIRVLQRIFINFDEIALFAERGGSFGFLRREPEIYSEKDLILKRDNAL
ncbi:hypothetical protein HYV91_01085 [Candidatus Wolfebacteria bacterium]|nr:hypothetical protein [Candidatus Wolfebacteria bacterium]